MFIILLYSPNILMSNIPTIIFTTLIFLTHVLYDYCTKNYLDENLFFFLNVVLQKITIFIFYLSVGS